jgi:two-component system, LytTR family, response regulator
MAALFKAVIVDDEPPAIRLLTGMLNKFHSFIQIVGEANNGAKAIALINSVHPDLVFLDIHLSDMLGFEVIRNLTCKPYFIFTTAYDAYAMKAFDELSIDYLLKPIKEGRLGKALDKLQKFVNGPLQPPGYPMENLAHPFKVKREIKTLSVKKGHKFTLIQLDEILYLRAQDKYANIFLTNGQKIFCDFMLMALEEKLSGNFIRVQKSFIVNRDKVLEIHKYSNNRFTLVLNDRAMTRIVTGPSYFEIIKDSFGVR